MRITEFDLTRDVDPIRGGDFTIRTFADDHFGAGRRSSHATLDRLVTVTLPAIDGERHSIVPTMEVVL